MASNLIYNNYNPTSEMTDSELYLAHCAAGPLSLLFALV